MKEKIPVSLDSAILSPPAGGLVEPALAQMEKGKNKRTKHSYKDLLMNLLFYNLKSLSFSY